MVVEYHDIKGKISYHRKVIKFKLYERKARYVDTVAAEFNFPEPHRSELFVVYTDARKTSYRVNYGHDMLRPDEELRYDLDWTDCYFIYKSVVGFGDFLPHLFLKVDFLVCVFLAKYRGYN